MYSPKIKDYLVRRLYQLKQVERKPMTVLANEAVEEYLRKKLQSRKEVNSYERSELHRSDTC